MYVPCPGDGGVESEQYETGGRGRERVKGGRERGRKGEGERGRKGDRERGREGER